MGKVVDERLAILKAISFWDDQFRFVLHANVATSIHNRLGLHPQDSDVSPAII